MKMNTPAEMIDKLRGDLLDLNEQTRNIQAKADAENGRPLTEDETKEVNRLMAEFSRVEEEIDRRETMLAQTNKLKQVFPPKAHPQNPEPQTAADPAMRQSGRVPRVEVDPGERGKWGWRNFGEFAVATRRASLQGGNIDPRLVANAPSSYNQEGVGEDGGFLVPPDFRQEIMKKVNGVDSLFSRTNQLVTASNYITFPADETTPWQSSGGVQGYWTAEGAQLSQSKAAFKKKTLEMHELTALVPVTSEMLEDAPTITGYLGDKVPQVFDYKIQNAIINGSGTGTPLGILNAACTVSVAKDTTTSPTQAAATFTYRNATDMMNALYAPCRNNSVWLINQDVEPQLQRMRFDNNRSSNPIPVYLPPGMASASPYSTLLGRPVIPVESCAALGTVGDVILADLSKYLTVTKSGGIRMDVSIHLFFDYNTSAFRFIFRIGGMPWWGSSITLPNSSQARSCFVTVATRA